MHTQHTLERATLRATISATEAGAIKARQKQNTQAAILNSLPTELGRNRILSSETAAAYWGVSVSHWRRLYRAGKVPRPIKVGERKLGWRAGVLADALANRSGEG
jgi:predicted DNA-binding transcriptional regulator AlpA